MIPQQIITNIALVAIVIFIALAILAAITSSKASHNPPILDNYIYTQFEVDIIATINKYRNKKNIPPLQTHNHLSNIAQRHTMRMALDKGQSHCGFACRANNITKALSAQDVRELLSIGQSTSGAMLTMWRIDDICKEILMMPHLTHIGVSIIEDGKQTPYCTVMLAQLNDE